MPLALAHDAPGPAPRPGALLARGVCRHLLAHDVVTVEEMVPATGLRVDVMGLGPSGEIWVVECKSSRADFAADRKWRAYLDFCDRFFWAVDADFPVEILPEDTGLIVADAYDAEIVRWGPDLKLHPSRRRGLVQRFARHAARRWHGARDPGLGLGL
ncbi:MmcB family DNA repair protein [Rubellimicrobium sp. CFH 75288]|uniref:MmcB family DNA repair protein n=1 Tax=Rubellimicrobium sp. CFH 75288 TaxID=2697034 RepID=UPI001413158C|nr:MmcB family DNA repair protein [Rubellimicrobium sp. CFH 75288]NAZ35990.1 MmcB family DNA repair protein [Rubellimicrobium sp. CFH 75288]